MQQAHVHEVGHLLGMEHVDVGKPHCLASGDTNASACYGMADADKNSVMGHGMRLREEHAAPWIRAINEFIKVQPASKIYTIPPPTMARMPTRFLSLLTPFVAKMSRHYPRTPTELESGRLITSG